MTDLISATAALSPLVLAQTAAAQPDQPAVWWIIGLAGAAVIFNQVAQSWKTLTNRFRERDSGGPRSPTEAECESRHNLISTQLQNITEQAQGRSESLRQEIKKDLGGVHQRIDEVLRAVARLEGKVG
jgi:uncharacterized protein HemX